MPTHNIDLANEKAPQQGELLRGSVRIVAQTIHRTDASQGA